MIELFVLQAAENGLDSQEAWVAIVSIVGGMTLVTVIAAVLIWQVAATWRARMSVAREEAYKRLAQESSDVQHRTAATLDAIQRELTGISQRTTELERLMKEIE